MAGGRPIIPDPSRLGMEPVPPVFQDALRAMGLLRAGETTSGAPLTGGVSSDIWHLTLPSGRHLCAKRALARLRVDAEWTAPVVRNLYEARWMRHAAGADPRAVPALLGQDEATETLAMEWLPPETFRSWKSELRDGVADPAFAAEVGRRLGRIHAYTAMRPELASEFPTDDIFRAIRLEPYLLATAAVHAELAPVLEALARDVATQKRALVHGDVSPKNILAGPDGPVFLDAECAWWGDPAFDLAFCLNHLLLKCLWTKRARSGFLACFDALASAYLAVVDWEAADALEARAARLLPGLLLARVDGKSPVEYLTVAADKDRARRVARAFLSAPASRLAAVRHAWREEVEG